MKRPELLLAICLVVAACASPRGLSTHGTVLPPDALRATEALAQAPEGEPPQRGWWKRYGDAQLDTLIDEAMANNPTVQGVRARFEQARAAAAAARLGLIPTVQGTVSSSRQRLSEHGLIPPPYAGMALWQNQAMLQADYEFDFWGRNRNAYEAALGQVAAAHLDGEAARLLLETTVTRAYLQLQSAFEQADIAHAALADRERILDITRARVDAGLDSRMELRQAEGAVPQARGEDLAAQQAITLARSQLAALLGQGADRGLAIRRASLQARPGALPSRLPADLLGRRPDVAAQRMRIESAAHGIESARAAFYPNIDLAAFAGLSAIDFSHFLDPRSFTGGIGPALRLPFFESGRLRADLQARQAEWDRQVAQYNETLVAALREVVDAATTLQALRARQAEAAAALQAAEQANAIALERYRAGMGNYLQVLAVEAQLLAQRALDAELRARRLDAEVALVHAVGGGYDAASLAAAIH